MAIPNPNPNIEDGKKCDNKTYSSNKIESLVAEATELPTPEAGDAGKVLTVNAAEDGYKLDAIPKEVPDTAAADAGKVPTVNAGGTAYELSFPAGIKSITLVTTTATTGGSGNISTPVDDDDKHIIVNPCVVGANYWVECWRNGTLNSFYLTVRDAATMSTVNSTKVTVKYWLVELE